jgi:hypothetical protein
MSKVYIYQSCSPVATNATKNSQVIQTEKIYFTDIVNTIFKDSQNNCWTYYGEYESGYIPPTNVFPINYSGNYFSSSVNIVYPDCTTCQVTTAGNCTINYFSGTRCDNGNSVYVKVCNVGPVSGNLQLLPLVGQVYGIYNPTGDDFCVTINSSVTYADTDYEITTPAWETYTCTTCPLYNKYIVDACDGSTTGLTVYESSSMSARTVGTSVTLEYNNDCYIITSYEGVFSEYNYQQGITPTIFQGFDTCDDCLINYYNT